MSNADADAISAQIIKQKGWHVAATAKQTFLEQRLMAGLQFLAIRRDPRRSQVFSKMPGVLVLFDRVAQSPESAANTVSRLRSRG
jgi:hypothetical protein